MFDGIFRKLSIGMGFVALAIVFAVITLRAHTKVTGGDTGFHLKAGEYIAHHGIPTTEVFTCSLAGQRWIDHEWLWQVLLYSLRQAFGDWGLISLQAWMTVTMFLILLLLGYRRDRIFLVAFLLFLVPLVAPTRPLMRPDNVSLWFSLIYIFLLWLFLKRPWTIYVLFILQVLWTNIHGFFIFGPLFALVILASEYAKRHLPLPYEWNMIGRLNDDEYRRLKKIGVALILACFINPQFVQGAWYPIKIMLDAPGESRFFYSYIGELRRPVSIDNFLNPNIHPIYKVLIILSAVGFILNRRKIDLRVFIFWLIFLCFSLAAGRNLHFFAPAAYLSLIVNLSNIRLDTFAAHFPVSKSWYKLRYLVIIVLQLGFIVWVNSYGRNMMMGNDFDTATLKLLSSYGKLSKSKFQHRVGDFLANHNIRGNIFNNLDVGPHLIVRNYPHIKVFIDGRTEVFGAKFFKTYREIWEQGNWDIFQKEVNRLNIEGAVLSSVNKPIPSKFLRQIYSHPEWKLIYFDYDAVVFLKDIPQNQDTIARLAVDLSQWKTTPVDAKLLHYPTLITPYYNRAVTLKDLGFYEQAEREIDETLRIQPTYVRAIILKAQICQSRGRVQEALELFQQALRYDPKSISVMMETAFIHDNEGDYESAILLSQKMIDQAPKDPRGHFVLSRALAGKTQYSESYAALVKACQLNLEVENILTVVDVFYSQKAYSWARKACDLALTREKNTSDTCDRLDLVHEAQGTELLIPPERNSFNFT